MGKQSGRLYYNGEDHLDVAFMDGERMYNHSKIYKGPTLLWKREMPKYMMLDFPTIYESNLFTSEALKTISSFMRCPSNKNNYQNNVYNSFYDIEYAFGKYFSVFVVSTLISSKAEYTCYICYSEDGYDWKKIQNIQFEKGLLVKLKRYVYGSNEVLTIITPHSIMFMDADYNLRTIFNYQNETLISAKIRTKMGVMLISGSAHNIVAHGEDFSIVTKDGGFYSNASKEGYFYRLTSGSGNNYPYNIFRSSDAINWTFVKTIRVFPHGEDPYGRVEIENIHVHNGYLYVLSKYGGSDVSFPNYPYIIRTGLEDGSEEEKLFDDKCDISFVLNDMIFIKPISDVYETQYLVKYEDMFGEMPEQEIVRITCALGGLFGLLGGKPRNIASTDYELDITI